MPHFAKMEKITLAYELSRGGLEAPKNWVFVNATNILEKNLPFLDKIQLDHMYPPMIHLCLSKQTKKCKYTNIVLLTTLATATCTEWLLRDSTELTPTLRP